MSAADQSKLLALKRAIQAALKASGLVADVQPFSRLLEGDDIRAVGFISPGAFVSLLAAPGSQAMSGGDSRVKIEVAVAIASKGKPGLEADEQTLAVAEAVFNHVSWKQWGLSGIWPAENRRMEIMPVPGRTGVALLAVRWEHFVRLGATYPDPLGVDETLRPTDPPTLTLGDDTQ